MHHERNYIRSAILMTVAAPLGPLLLALGLDYLWLGKPLMESLRHWSSAAMGVPIGIFLVFLIIGLFRRWRAGKSEPSPDIDRAQ